MQCFDALQLVVMMAILVYNTSGARARSVVKQCQQNTVGADCHLYNDYCGGCNCIALPIGEIPTECDSENLVSCFVAPCLNKSVECSALRRCKVSDESDVATTHEDTHNHRHYNDHEHISEHEEDNIREGAGTENRPAIYVCNADVECVVYDGDCGACRCQVRHFQEKRRNCEPKRKEKCPDGCDRDKYIAKCRRDECVLRLAPLFPSFP
mmetsp:Transcript_28286/g.32532  ORF Transcript_28286/g.32532 Transcript_28286/m.32532 type:complete len:210 (-) Transcript_28286:215-844(-)